MVKTKAFVIGDVHGQLLRLETILTQEGIIDTCPACVGEGDVSDGTGEAIFCSVCKGNGLARVDFETEVVQLGDLVDLMPSRTSPTQDEMTQHFADQWVDVFLIGNHEGPALGYETFSGYVPDWTVTLKLLGWQKAKRLKLAHSFQDRLITHAGLSDKAFGNILTGRLDRYDVDRLARWINRRYQNVPVERQLVDNMPAHRGGKSPYGGILWRDSSEDLWPVPQVFGHTSHSVAYAYEHGPDDAIVSYGIDTSKHDSVSGIWLPENRVVTVRDNFSWGATSLASGLEFGSR